MRGRAAGRDTLVPDRGATRWCCGRGLARRALGAAGRVATGQLLDGLLARALRNEEAAGGPGTRALLPEDVGLAAAAEDRRDRDLREREAPHVADERLRGVPADERSEERRVG